MNYNFGFNTLGARGTNGRKLENVVLTGGVVRDDQNVGTSEPFITSIEDASGNGITGEIGWQVRLSDGVYYIDLYSIDDATVTVKYFTAYNDLSAISVELFNGEVTLDKAFGRAYATYDMADGALTFSVASNARVFGFASGRIIADGVTEPDVSALTLYSGVYVNENDVVNRWYIVYEYDETDTLTAYLSWSQQETY